MNYFSNDLTDPKKESLSDNELVEAKRKLSELEEEKRKLEATVQDREEQLMNLFSFIESNIKS